MREQRLDQLVRPADAPVVALDRAQVVIERLGREDRERAAEAARPVGVEVGVAPLLGGGGLLGARVDHQVEPVDVGVRIGDPAGGGEHAAERLRLDQAAVGVPEVPGLGKAVDALAAVAVLVAAAVEDARGEGAGVGGGGEDEVER